ncbi:unnamed protein product [Rhizoctonia solani]|uniref:BTB domain-containing protein n=1 Tax=Rhizoctonia solani TaxID=456999 RepID=A0A8H3HV15_9AGAM|nr:unnamed protein product [Rhizoctonia solani]
MPPPLTMNPSERNNVVEGSRVSIAESTSFGSKASPTASVRTVTAPDDLTLPVHPEFTYEDGNIEVKTLDHLFWVHEFLLKKFTAFRESITRAREKGLMSTANTSRLRIKVNSHSGNIVGAFRVLYASVFPGPQAHQFNSATLTKALRVATLYGCLDIREYAISELEKRFTFLPIVRIRMSDEFKLPAWEKSALIELCRRIEPITGEEANVLGVDRLAAISRIREAEQRRKFVELVEKSVGCYGLLVDKKGRLIEDKLRADAKYTLMHQLPKCDCGAQRMRNDTQLDDRHRIGPAAPASNNRHSIADMFPRPSEMKDSRFSAVPCPCQIQKVAPYVISESHALFKQRNDLVQRLGNLKIEVSNQIPQADKKDFSVEDEINRGTWYTHCISALKYMKNLEFGVDLGATAIRDLIWVHSAHLIREVASSTLSDELNLPDWEIPAFLELCRRSEPISPEEATVLGIARFTEISRIREGEQRRQYMELIDKVSKDPLMTTDGTVMKDKLQATAEQTLKSSSIPTCNCRVGKPGARARSSAFHLGTRPPTRPTLPVEPVAPEILAITSSFFGSGPPPTTDPEPSSPIVTCQLHQLAPSIASESRTLYRHLSNTLERIETLKRTVSKNTLPGSDPGYSVEDELKEANWVRKTA